jgi:RecA/RadA recombinase
MAKQFSFDELDGAMSKIDSLGSKMSVNQYSRIDEWIGTGNYLLNAQISGSIFKGIPNSRSIVFSGVSGCGKTFMILNALREAQAKGYFAIYGDSEAAVDEELMIKFNIDPTRVRYQPLKTVIQTRHFIANLCQQLKEKRDKGFEVPKIMMIIDSLGNLATEKETADALSGSDKRDMTKQQNLKSMFRIITTDLAELKIPLLVTNHVYASIGGYFPSNVQSGGTGAIYNASIILEFTKAGLKDGDQDAADAGQAKTGLIITSKVVKNRFVRPIPIKFHLSFYKGMNPYVGLENYTSWEACGIGRGKLTEEILEELQWEDEAKTVPKMFRGKQKVERTKTGNWIYERDDKANTFAIKHLNRTIKGSGIFNGEVFSREVLEAIDKVIGPIFHFPKTVSDEEELDAMLDDGDDDVSDSHTKLFNQSETVAEVNQITEEAASATMVKVESNDEA